MATNIDSFEKVCPSTDVLVPSVSPADLKSIWSMKNEFQIRHPGQPVSIGMDDFQRACGPEADLCAVLSRVSMLEKVQYAADAGHFIFPWTHDGRPEDIVFKIVATIPMVASKAGVVQEGFPIDVEELIRQIKNESRI